MNRAILFFLSVGLALPAAGETLLYTLEVPAGNAVTYEIPFEPSHEGRGAIVAEWAGHRMLAFRVESPGPWSRKFRRNGPSPQRLEFDVDAYGVGTGPWKLTVVALASSGGGAGTISIELPDEVVPGPPPEAPEIPTPSAVDLPAQWELPRNRIEGLPPAWNRLQTVAEELRRVVVDRTTPDACSWQSDLLRFSLDRLDRRGLRDSIPARETRELLAEMAETIDLVERYRVSKDPRIAGPPPRTERDLRSWTIERRERYMALEAKLDGLIRSIRRGHAPELARDDWPLRLISCITACERHFEERVRVGAELAANRELTEVQWERILVARRVLEALGHLE